MPHQMFSGVQMQLGAEIDIQGGYFLDHSRGQSSAYNLSRVLAFSSFKFNFSFRFRLVTLN